MRHVYLTKEDLIDSYGWKGNLDLLNIIMLGKTEGLTIDEKLKSFGFQVINIDGNDIEEILKAFEVAKNVKEKPTVIIAKTIKGKGVSFMENQVGWHGKAPNEEQYEIALKELQND